MNYSGIFLVLLKKKMLDYNAEWGINGVCYDALGMTVTFLEVGRSVSGVIWDEEGFSEISCASKNSHGAFRTEIIQIYFRDVCPCI